LKLGSQILSFESDVSMFAICAESCWLQIDLAALPLEQIIRTKLMSTKRKEMTLAVAQVIRKMDALLGISDDITMALLGDVTETEIEMKLDIQILYLRRVHHFCFYAGRWCKDCTNGRR